MLCALLPTGALAATLTATFYLDEKCEYSHSVEFSNNALLGTPSFFYEEEILAILNEFDPPSGKVLAGWRSPGTAVGGSDAIYAPGGSLPSRNAEYYAMWETNVETPFVFELSFGCDNYSTCSVQNSSNNFYLSGTTVTMEAQVDSKYLGNYELDQLTVLGQDDSCTTYDLSGTSRAEVSFVEFYSLHCNLEVSAAETAYNGIFGA